MDPQFKETKIDRMVMDILSKGIGSTSNVTHKFIIHYKKTKSIYILDIKDVVIKRDFVANTTDDISVRFLIPMGDYVKVLQKYKDDLEITLIRRMGPYTTSIRYKFIITNDGGLAESGIYADQTLDDLNRGKMATIEGKCTDRFAYMFSTVLAEENIFKKKTVKDVITLTLDKAKGLVKLNNDSIFTEINISEPNNGKIYEQIPIGGGVKAIDLPSIMQNKEYGVYSSGIGTYILITGGKRYINIFPLFNTKNRFLFSKKLRFIVTGSSFNNASNVSYMKSGGGIDILISDPPVIKNKSQLDTQNAGTAIIHASELSINSRSVKIEEDKVEANKENTTNAINDRDSGDGRVKAEHVGVTTNPYKYMEDSVRAAGYNVVVTWQHAVPDYIVPNREIEYLYVDTDNSIKVIKGVMHGAAIQYNNEKQKENCIAKIVLFLRN